MHAEPPTLDPPRRWSRPYATTWVFMGFLAVVLALLNVPGQLVVDTLIDEMDNRWYGPDSWYIHGWPFMALSRGPFYGASIPNFTSPWNLTEYVYSIDALAITLNALAAIVVVTMGGLLFQTWRLRGGSLRHFSLSTFFVVVTLIAVVIHYVVRERAAGQADRAALKAMYPDSPDGDWGTEWQPWGPTWLRKLLGENLFAGCDRVICIDIWESRQLDTALGLRELKVVGFPNGISDEDLQRLSALPNLDDLRLNRYHSRRREVVGGDPPRFTFPPLEMLRRLDLTGSRFRLAGLENLPGLEVLLLSNSLVDDDAMAGIGQLRNLRILDLGDTAVSSDGLAHLAGLKRLRELSLDTDRTDDAGIQYLANLTQLQSLTLGGEMVTDASINTLRQFSQLQYLFLYRTAITSAGVARLAGLHDLQESRLRESTNPDALEVPRLGALRTLRDLRIVCCSLTDAAVPGLSRFTHLEILMLAKTKITPAGFAALRAALPNCSIRGESSSL